MKKPSLIKVIIDGVHHVENILKRKYNFEKNERNNMVYIKPDKTQEEMRKIRENVELAKDMHLNISTEEGQFFGFLLGIKRDSDAVLSQQLDDQGGVHSYDNCTVLQEGGCWSKIDMNIEVSIKCTYYVRK